MAIHSPTIQTNSRFEYHTDPVLPATLAVLGLVIAGALFRVMLFRILLIGTAAGPLAWTLFQLVRRGRAVILEADTLTIQYTLPRRRVSIPYHLIEGQAISARGGLALVYRRVMATPVPNNPSPYALSNARPESHDRPRHRFIATPAIDHIDVLLAELGTRLPAERPFEAEFMQVMLQRLRVRNTILIILAVMATPLYVILLTRFLGTLVR